MFSFLRNRGRSADGKHQEALSAYLDNELAPAERDRVEQQLAQNSDLRDELAEMKLWQAQMRNLPARRVPRNFTLDPVLYGRSQRRPLIGAYPMLRTATAVTAFLLVIAVAFTLFQGGGLVGETASESVSMAVQEMAPAAEEAAMAGAVLDETELAAEESPETFMFEESIDKEAAEAPVEIAETEAEEAAMESVEEEVLSEAEETLDGEDLLSAKPDLSPALDLDMVEETAEPPVARDSSAFPVTEAPLALQAEIEQAEEALQPEIPLEQAPEPPPPAAEGQNLMQPVAAEDTVLEVQSPIASALVPITIGLALLFLLLAILTLLARARR